MTFTKNNFDLIRLFAASQVAVVHAIHHFDFHHWVTAYQLLRLFPGVPIFFVISGFLISASFERNRNVKRYYSARFLRIFPGLWACFFVSIFIAWFFVEIDFFSRTFLIWFVSQISIAQFYHPEFLRSFGVGVLNGSLWTIPVELQFYILLPFIYWLIDRFRLGNTTLIAIVITLAVFQVLSAFSPNQYDTYLLVKLFRVSIVPHLYLFLIGVLIQRNLEQFLEIYQKKFLFILVLYLCIALFGRYSGIPVLGGEINPVSASLLAILIIVVAYSKVPERTILKGYDLSYGVYIYHMVFINTFIELGFRGNMLGIFYSLIFTALAAYLSWTLVEKPALLLKKRTSA